MPSCNVCGGSDFNKQHGFYYCSECHTQSQGKRDEVFDDDFDWEKTVNLENTVYSRCSDTSYLDSVGGYDWTSWEGHNAVLKGMVDELIALGASPELKSVVLQLWVRYLQSLQVGFITKTDAAKPDLSRCNIKRDAEVLHGIPMKKPRKKYKYNDEKSWTKLLSKVDAANVCELSERDQKKWLRLKKKELFKLMCKTDAPESDSDCDEPSQDANNSEFLPDAASTPTCNKEQAKKSDTPASRTSRLNEPEPVTRTQLLSLIYIALMLLKDSIQLSDLIRWIRENHLSFCSVKHLIPPGMNFHRRDLLFLRIQCPPTSTYIRCCTGRLVRFLDIKEIPSPPLSSLVGKYATELNLPSGLVKCVERFLAFAPPSSSFFVSEVGRKDSPKLPNYEGRALAIIIVTLKLLFGLDDSTEHNQSRCAQAVNRVLESSDEDNIQRLFVWDKWVEFMEFRKWYVKQHYFPAQYCIDPDGFGNPELYAKFRKTVVLDERETQNAPSSISASETMEIVMAELVENSDSGMSEFKASRYPYKSVFETMVHKLSASEKKALPPVASSDFSNTSIEYVLNPETCRELQLLQDCPQSVNVKNGPSRRRCIQVEMFNKRDGILRNKLIGISIVNNAKKKKEESAENVLGENSSSSSDMQDNEDCIHLPIPYSDYWVRFGNLLTLSAEDFNGIFNDFPNSFKWLLDVCASSAELPVKDLYDEVLLVENVLFYKTQTFTVNKLPCGRMQAAGLNLRIW